MGLFHQMHRTLWKNENGFGLIEMSIALIIFSMLFGKGFSLWQAHNRARKHEVTLQHQRLIFKALAHYLQQNGCLPYPCFIENTTRTQDQWGKSSAYDPRNGSLNPGIIPYRTLCLPERVAKDGFGHFMTYVVDVRMTQKYQHVKSRMCERFFSQQSALDMIENGHSVKAELENNAQKYKPATGLDGAPVKNQRYEGLAVILVSHGRHGWGAPQSSGQYIPIPPSAPKELHNNGGKGTVFWLPESGATAIEYGVVQGKTRTSILDDAYLGCADYFYAEDSVKRLPQGSTQNSTSNATGKNGLAGGRFTQSELGQSFNPHLQQPLAQNNQP